MVTEDIQGIPELPEIPSTPIFPSKEVGTRPRLPGEGRPNGTQGKRSLTSDRVEFSNESRAFNASRILFDRIAVEFQKRQSDGEPALPAIDSYRIEDELLKLRDSSPDAAAEAVLQEIRGAARSNGRGADASKFQRFQSAAREAVSEAFQGARAELEDAEQLDETTAKQLDATATKVFAGIDALTPN